MSPNNIFKLTYSNINKYGLMQSFCILDRKFLKLIYDEDMPLFNAITVSIKKIYTERMPQNFPLIIDNKF